MTDRSLQSQQPPHHRIVKARARKLSVESALRGQVPSRRGHRGARLAARMEHRPPRPAPRVVSRRRRRGGGVRPRRRRDCEPAHLRRHDDSVGRRGAGVEMKLTIRQQSTGQLWNSRFTEKLFTSILGALIYIFFIIMWFLRLSDGTANSQLQVFIDLWKSLYEISISSSFVNQWLCRCILQKTKLCSVSVLLIRISWNKFALCHYKVDLERQNSRSTKCPRTVGILHFRWFGIL